MAGGYYHTGDVASRDDDGYITYIGRTDDVFKSSDYKVSPFELESVLIEHSAVVEAAVVPQHVDTRCTVPKAYISLADGVGAERRYRQGDHGMRHSRRISRCGEWSSTSCPRRSRAKSAASGAAGADDEAPQACAPIATEFRYEDVLK